MKVNLSVTIPFRSAFEGCMKIECQRCIFFAFDECHFNAPTAEGFPHVEARDWCRHFATRADVQQEEIDEV